MNLNKSEKICDKLRKFYIRLLLSGGYRADNLNVGFEIFRETKRVLMGYIEKQNEKKNLLSTPPLESQRGE